MTDAEVEAVVAAVPTLKPAQLARLHAALLAVGKPKKDRSRAVEALHAAVAAELRAAGLAVWGVSAYRAHPSFGRNAEAILAYVKKNVAPKNHGEELLILRMLVRLVLKDLKRRGKPADQAAVVWGVERACPLLECAFPGYREAGLLHLLLKRKK